MKACVLEKVGKLTYKEVMIPKVGKDEVLLQIKACGICSSDIDRIYKTGTYHFPTIPGHEFSGVVVEVGDGISQSYKGKHAVVFPLKPCFKCSYCMEKKYARCDEYDYYGSRCDGAFAEYVAVKFWNLVFYEGISDEEAAICEPAAVALHAAESVDIKKQDIVTVIGDGTIGCLIAKWAKILGAEKVLLAGHNIQKLNYLKNIHFFEVLNTTSIDYDERLKNKTKGKMANIVFECVGKSESIEKAIMSVRKGGILVLVGNPTGDLILKRNCYWNILRKEIRVIGIWNSEFNDINNNWKRVLEYIKSGELEVKSLITHRFKISEYQEAFDTLKNKNIITLKVMLINEQK